MALEIDLAKLKMILMKIIDDVTANVSRVSLKDDDYWEIDSNDRYDLTKVPGDPVVGKLSDDWDFLLPLLDDDADEAVPYLLVHVAPLLRAIAESDVETVAG